MELVFYGICSSWKLDGIYSPKFFLRSYTQHQVVAYSVTPHLLISKILHILSMFSYLHEMIHNITIIITIILREEVQFILTFLFYIFGIFFFLHSSEAVAIPMDSQLTSLSFPIMLLSSSQQPCAFSLECPVVISC